MRRAIARLQKEQGQTLVWVAGGLTVLMIMLAFAIDIGTLQGERRHMQNAADAAALEAARARCYDSASSSVARASGETFATAKYSSRPFAAVPPTFSVTEGRNSWEFVATGTETVKLAFAGVFSSGQVSVSAVGAAACNSSPQACGLFPIALSDDVWDPISGDCGQLFYVWTSDHDKDPQGNQDPTPTPVPPPDCVMCNCEEVYEGNTLVPGGIAITDVGRAWLDFSSIANPPDPLPADYCAESQGCGTNELRCWILTPEPPVFRLVGDCVSGTQGVKAGVRQDVNEREGDYVNIPIFEDTACSPPEGVKDNCGEGYKIAKFGCVQVAQWPSNKINLDWKMTPTPDPAQPNKPTPKWCFSEKMMAVRVGCNGCETDCGKVSEGGNPGSGIKAINLIAWPPD